MAGRALATWIYLLLAFLGILSTEGARPKEAAGAARIGAGTPIASLIAHVSQSGQGQLVKKSMQVSTAANMRLVKSGFTRHHSLSTVGRRQHDVPLLPVHNSSATSWTPSSEAPSHIEIELNHDAPIWPKSNMFANSTLAAEAIVRDIGRKAKNELKAHLQHLAAALTASPDAFDVNVVMAPEMLNLGGSSNSMTLLALAAKSGWQAGVTELIVWDKGRQDGGSRLQVDSGGPYGSPLVFAVEEGHHKIVQCLIMHNASTTVSNAKGLTLLEMAILQGSTKVTKALLGKGSVLHQGLLPLRQKLSQQAVKLPKLTGRWPFGSLKGDEMDKMRKTIPPPLRPSERDKLIIGEQPASWILLYQMRVMCSLANRMGDRNGRLVEIARLLSNQGFDNLIREFHVCVLMLCMLFIVFGVLGYIIFRIKVFGGCDAPVSLADLIPGAFDPARYLDPDFDPSNQRMKKLPYRLVREHLPAQSLALTASAWIYGQALMGIYCSWWLQCVRIPPEKDPYDEDYLSDDDEEARERVREQCASKGSTIRCLEVAIRISLLVALLFWLIDRTKRWGDATLLLLPLLCYSLFALKVAKHVVPSPVPERAPADTNAYQEGTRDAAWVVNSLFCVQHGPQWTRSVSTTRSTASPNKNRIARRRLKRPMRLRSGEGDGNDRSSSGVDIDQTESRPAAGDISDTVGQTELTQFHRNTSFSDWFQRSFLASGLMHTQHGAYLEGAVLNLSVISLSLVWFLHMRALAYGNPSKSFKGLTPVQVLCAYGEPMTADRWAAMFFEVALILFAGERLFGTTNLLNVASLTLVQRHRALRFAAEHRPPVVRIADDKSTHASEVICHVEECVRCIEFASELSLLRWSVLRESAMAILFCTIGMMLIAVLIVLLPRMNFTQNWLLVFVLSLDPVIPLCLGFCILCPLARVLMLASLVNGEVTQQCNQIWSTASAALSNLPLRNTNDVHYVKLRVKAQEALQTSKICWSNGRELGNAEPFVLMLGSLLGLGFTCWGNDMLSLR